MAVIGLQNLDIIVQLQQGTNATIRNLLFAVPAPTTSNKKLFLQVECQAGSYAAFILPIVPKVPFTLDPQKLSLKVILKLKTIIAFSKPKTSPSKLMDKQHH